MAKFADITFLKNGYYTVQIEASVDSSSYAQTVQLADPNNTVSYILYVFGANNANKQFIVFDHYFEAGTYDICECVPVGTNNRTRHYYQIRACIIDEPS